MSKHIYSIGPAVALFACISTGPAVRVCVDHCARIGTPFGCGGRVPTREAARGRFDDPRLFYSTVLASVTSRARGKMVETLWVLLYRYCELSCDLAEMLRNTVFEA